MAGTEYRGPLRSALTGLGVGTIAAELLLPPELALGCPPAGDRSVWHPSGGRADPSTLRDLLARATADLDQLWPQPLASTAVRVHRDGDRSRHEGLVFARQQRLSRAAIAAAVSLEPRFVDAVADGVWQLCEQTSWCWPAHDDCRLRHGSVLPVVSDPQLDLGAGEVVAQLAWIDQLLGAQLDRAYPGLRARIRYEAQQRVFGPFTGRRDWHWLGLDGDVHNWNPWIHGNLLVGALRLLDAPAQAAERARIVDLVVTGLDRYVAALPDDGAIDEGYHYWWAGACRALEALELLRHATSGRADLLGLVPALRATIGFPHRLQLGPGWVMNPADGSARAGDAPWDVLYRAGRQVGDAAAAGFAAAQRRPGEPVAHESAGLGRLLRAVTDADWLAATPLPAPPPQQVWLESVQLRLVRERADSFAGLTLVVKGGHNDEHHNHNDVGEVVVASDGVPVLVDAGRPTYTAATFGPERYRLWPMQSAWHNVPRVRGTQQAAGRGFRATAVEPLDNGLALDLATAYPVEGLAGWRRSARLTDGTIAVRDAWQLVPWPGAEPEPPTTVCFLVAGRVTLSPGRAEVVPLAGATPLRLEWPADIPAHSSLRTVDDPMLNTVWGDRLTRIELDVTGRHDLLVTVRQVTR